MDAKGKTGHFSFVIDTRIANSNVNRKSHVVNSDEWKSLPIGGG
jgi:hypothetical protein